MFLLGKEAFPNSCLYDFFSSLQWVEYALWPIISEKPCIIYIVYCDYGY